MNSQKSENKLNQGNKSGNNSPAAPKRGRGRPKRSDTVAHPSTLSPDPQSPKRGRGRPRKVQPVAPTEPEQRVDQLEGVTLAGSAAADFVGLLKDGSAPSPRAPRTITPIKTLVQLETCGSRKQSHDWAMTLSVLPDRIAEIQPLQHLLFRPFVVVFYEVKSEEQAAALLMADDTVTVAVAAPAAEPITGDLVGVQTLARVLGLSPRTIQNLERDGVVIKRNRGEYDLAASIQGYIRHQTEAATRELASLSEERAGLTAARRQQAELELAETRGDLVRRVDIEREYGKFVVDAKTHLSALHSTLAPRLVGLTAPEIAIEIRKETDYIQIQLAGGGA